jgi:hypothetical protein
MTALKLVLVLMANSSLFLLLVQFFDSFIYLFIRSFILCSLFVCMFLIEY